MKISFRFRHVLPLLLVLLTDRAFTEFVIKEDDDPALGLYNYAITGLSLLLIALYFRYLSPIMRKWLLVVLAATGALALESYNGWGTPFVYPHVFAKLMAILPVFAMYAYYRRHPLPMGLLMFLVLTGLALSMALYHPDALSLTAFLETERGFNVTSAFLLMLPALYYFNQYVTQGGLLRLALFFIILALIVFLQHRTVWLTMTLALVVNGLFIALGRVEGARVHLNRMLPILVMPLLAGLLGGTALVLDNPQVLRKLETNVEDITHADKQGTGSWRLKQWEAYESFVQEHPVVGMRLEGFELPMQFYGDGDHPVWADRTGHHFHSFYLDRLFYFGILGVLLVMLLPLWQLVKRAFQPVPFSAATATLLSFTSTALLYGVSYDWPPYLYGLIGITMAVAAPLPFVAAKPLTPAGATVSIEPTVAPVSAALGVPA
ncbi:O-antigen ligase family protein [Hymenobacter rigui]|uniref:O-antigen ligase domain-containing protein n=1 Tax=Hymenobacter rigui TaxID=334424 RepID=A0A428KR75_9BACT|nr:O-antigen ligase family protein [Hymenobacter rigui]RSK48992.1 O-antigen ligase domain-containing protein [Hymenobacter rigui]